MGPLGREGANLLNLASGVLNQSALASLQAQLASALGPLLAGGPGAPGDGGLGGLHGAMSATATASERTHESIQLLSAQGLSQALVQELQLNQMIENGRRTVAAIEGLGGAPPGGGAGVLN